MTTENLTSQWWAEGPSDAELELNRAVAGFMDVLHRGFGVPKDGHTEDTPRRVAESWAERLQGYGQDAAAHLAKTFPVDGEPGLVVVAGIEVRSSCAHHLLPITGAATIAYRPAPGTGRVVGLSKLARVFEVYARRLQVQEQLGAQTLQAIVDGLAPAGAAVLITAEHGCMTERGVLQRGTATTTEAVAGDWVGGGADLEAARLAHERAMR